ncbi:hypothetical protein NC651_010496 [Populus alba x Populus x berolinensis]|nr:hypothetical protein NC651_010496 [Populus alba x Populus x berolinensis]
MTRIPTFLMTHLRGVIWYIGKKTTYYSKPSQWAVWGFATP